MFKRVLALLLTLTLLLSCVSMASATEQPETWKDMPQNSYKQALLSAVENGLLQGSNGYLKPHDYLTRAQMAAVLNRAFAVPNSGNELDGYTDASKSAWYYTDLCKAVYVGALQGSGDMLYPERAMTREELFTVLARFLALEPGSNATLNQFKDANQVSSWAAGATAAMIAAGYVNGSNGYIRPKDSITREQFAQVMHNVLKQYIDEPGTYEKLEKGCVIVRVPDVTLKNCVITGDLILSDGLDDGDVILDNVEVKGRIVVRSGQLIIRESDVGEIVYSGPYAEADSARFEKGTTSGNSSAGRPFPPSRPDPEPTPDPTLYTISWDTDGDGDVDDTTTVAYGETPTHADGSKAADAQYTYTFTGWSPAIAPVTGAQTYSAQFSTTTNEYIISWDTDGDGEVDDTTTVAYGETPTHADGSKDPDAQNTYTFTGWSPEIAPVTGAQTYTAQFSTTPNSQIELSVQEAVQIYSDDSKQLTIELNPTDATVTVVSNDESIVTASISGTTLSMVAQSAGSTTLTIRAEKTGWIADEATITVKVLGDVWNAALNRPTQTDNVANNSETGAQAVDGNISETKWSTLTDSVVGTTHWLIVDLQKNRNVVGFNVYHAQPYESWASGHRINTVDYQVQISQDQNEWTTVTSVTGNNDDVNRILLDEGVSARYIRLYVTKGHDTSQANVQSTRIFEFEVLTDDPVVKLSVNDAVGVKLGQTLQVSLNCEPADATLSVIVENSEIVEATVVDGDIQVTGKKPGNTTLTVRAEKDGLDAAEKKIAVSVIYNDRNVAVGKLATASSWNLDNPLNAVDGDVTTKWSSLTRNAMQEQEGTKDQWITVDLGHSYNLTRYIVRHAQPYEGSWVGSMNMNTKDFRLEVSQDNKTWTTVDTVSQNSADVTEVEFSESVEARYVRLYITDACVNCNNETVYNARIMELEIYSGDEEPISNAALNRPVITSSNADNKAEYGGGAVDGKLDTKWNSVLGNDPHWMVIDMQNVYSICGYEITHAGNESWAPATSLNTVAYQFQVSMDGTTWKTVDDVTGNSAEVTEKDFAEEVEARYVRVYITDPAAWDNQYAPAARIREVKVFTKDMLLPVQNLALYQEAEASSYSGEKENAAKAVDGRASSEGTKWNSTADDSEKMLTISLDDNYQITRYVVRHANSFESWQGSNNINTNSFLLQVSNNGLQWETVDTVTGNTADITDRMVDASGRFVRLKVTEPTSPGLSDSWKSARIFELEVYGIAGEEEAKEAPKVTTGYLINENFMHPKSYMVSTTNQVSGWDIDLTGGSLEYSEEDWFRIKDTSTAGNVTMHKCFADAQGSTLTWEFRFMMETLAESTFTMDSGLYPAIQVAIDNNNGLYYVAPNGEKVKLKDYNANTWYGVKVVADRESGSTDFYVNGKKIAEGIQFDSENVAQINGVQIQTGYNASGTMKIGMMHIYTGYAVNEKFLTTVGSLPEDWTFTGNAETFDTASMPTYDQQSLKLSGGASMQKAFTGLTGTVEVDFSMLLPVNCGGMEVALYSGDSPVATFSADANTFNLGSTDCYTYTKNVWYDFRLLLDLSANTADVYVNGILRKENVSISGTKIDSLRISTVTGGDPVWIDDIMVYPIVEVSDYVPEPVKPERREGAENVIIGMQNCSLWREGTHNGWDWIEPYANDRMPYLGWYDEGNPEVADWEIKWMLEHGVDYQLYCWYKPIHSQDAVGGTPIKQPSKSYGIDAFKAARYSDQMKYAIMWENGNPIFGCNGIEDFENNVLPFWIEHYFKDPRYLTVDNKIVVGLYNIGNFETQMGGTEKAREAIKMLEDACVDLGFAGVTLLAEARSYGASYGNYGISNEFDYEYTYTYSTGDPTTQKNAMTAAYQRAENEGNISPIATVSMGWQTAAWGYDSGNWATPQQFQDVLEWTRDEFMTWDRKDSNSLGSRMLVLDNWNEYGEGHFLMPSTLHGFGYLDAVRTVFCESSTHEDSVPTEEQMARFNTLYLK